jgi:hypothetical protein
MKKYVIILATCSFLVSCKNRDLNEGEEFRPRELHDNFKNSHFTLVEVDGVEYLMMERDNNNPHEGFGFMAFRANKLIAKQDTSLALMRTIAEYQIQLMAMMNKEPPEKIRGDFKTLFIKYLSEEQMELERLEMDSLIGK